MCATVEYRMARAVEGLHGLEIDTTEGQHAVMWLRKRNRRAWLGQAAAIALPCALPMARAADLPALRFGTTPVFLDNQVALLSHWQRYLQQKLGRQVVFLQRGS